MTQYVPKQATSITIVDCGDPECKCAHILLKDENSVGFAQATVSLRMVKSMLDIILSKGPRQ